jgi:branched-chain amino acid transport system ATP-binding protein
MLTVEQIDVFYGPIQALRSLTIDVRDREMVALLGANGAGKTTTLRAISGLIPVSAGSITFDGTALSGQPAHKIVTLGVAHVPEGRELFPQLSVADNLKMGYWAKRSHRGGYQAKLDEVMDHFPILRERSEQAAGTLSGGEQQMLVMARALMSSPSLLIVDELSLGLAPMIVSQLFDILRTVNRDLGTAVLLVEQFVHMALANTDRAYVLAKGEVAFAGPSHQILEDQGLLESYLGGGHAGEPETERPRRRRRPATQ